MKILTRMRDDPKVVGLSDKTFRAYVNALCWCGDHETDGVMPQAMMARPAMNELQGAGLIETEAVLHLLRIVNWSKHQRTRKQLDAVRAERRASGSKGGLAKAKAVATPTEVPELEVEVDLEELQEPPLRGPKENGNGLAAALLASDSTAQYLLSRLDDGWQEAVTPAVLMKLGAEYGAGIVTDALRNMRESQPDPDDHYPYLESACKRLEAAS